ncbi:MAG TPA: sulfotransferase [Candidatus Sulfotelmatobacter sp.]|nr:sulfotransferase [Candidatus Sulfotelmatobacter sp.]
MSRLAGDLMPPLVILSPGRSFSTVVSAMLGCHPELYALPETCLFVRDTMAEYLRDADNCIFVDGLIRAVAQQVFEGQTDGALVAAQEWIGRQRRRSTRAVFDELRKRAHPRRIIEKTPMTTARLEHLARIERFFSKRARFIHLTRHPRSYGASLVDTLLAMLNGNDVATVMRLLENDESIFYGVMDSDTGAIDPQNSWLRRHRRIDDFLAGIDEARWIRLRGEDVVTAPGRFLPHIFAWLGLPMAETALHPERWDFAARPRAGLSGGGDRKFFRDPTLRSQFSVPGLDGALRWRTDRGGFRPEVQRLAHAYGYD